MIHSFHRRLEFGKEKHKQNFPNESDGRRWKDESKQANAMLESYQLEGKHAHSLYLFSFLRCCLTADEGE